VRKQAPRQIKEIVASNIRKARIAKDLTQRALAEVVNDVDRLAVYRWEAGLVLPSQENFAALATVLGHDIAWFYTDHENEPSGAAA
jgi:transcriptional regulator with XRE-family HTH domain